MSPIRPSKRRRIDNAFQTLSKPFKSPFKTPLKPKIDTNANVPVQSTQHAKHRTTEPEIHSDSSPGLTPSLTKKAPTHRLFHTPHNPPSSAYSILQKKHTHLLNQLSAARTDLETSKQALTIENSHRDTELEALIQKWRIASRAAAEDVFAKARDRVNKMGGVAAMKDRERQSRQKAWGWDDEPKKKADGGQGDDQSEDEDDAGDDGAGFRNHEGDEEAVEAQDEREEGAKATEDDVGDEEGGYTMDMMLKTLNIDLDVIGYDKALQKWID